MRCSLDQYHERYAFLDPAGKRRASDLKKVRARAAIIVIGVDDLRRILVLEAWAEKASALTIRDKVFELNATWKPRAFGCEANAMQELYAEMLQLEAKRQGLSLPLTEVYQPTTIEKTFRIRTTLAPVVGFGRLLLRENQHELYRELTTFPMCQTFDLVDALASVCAMVPPVSRGRRQDAERDGHADYLRRSGYPAHLIESRLNELYGTAPVELPRAFDYTPTTRPLL